jgi:hypothetical protein
MSTTINEIFNLDNWTPVGFDWIQSNLKKMDVDNTTHPLYTWQNDSKKLSPLTLYKLLKARFGDPNGLIMYLKNRETTDNLIHWHYTFLIHGSEIHFLGQSRGIEIHIRIPNEVNFEKENWDLLINNIQSNYQIYKEQMKVVQKDFEKWTLFINPVTRLQDTLKELIKELRSLDIKEIKKLELNPSDEIRAEYDKNFNQWIINTERAVTLGTTIRMLTPVLAESFVNLLILLLSKNEFKQDKRLYENLIRQQIDTRVKTLHLNCDGFLKPIDSEKDEFKRFQTLMNNRNDFLHGNIDPRKLMFEDIYFDKSFIPLFEEDEGIIAKTMKNYLTNVEREKALADFTTVQEFINFILGYLTKDNQDLIKRLLLTRMPGLNEKTNRIGILFSNKLAEMR